MAKDTAAASLIARTLIDRMDRPSVERELRHVHGDTTFYSTAHAARDALAAARPAAGAGAEPSSTDLEGAPAGHPPAGGAGRADHPLERTPPGGWSDADRVPPARPADTSTYPSAQRYPLGTPLSVHAIGAHSPVRQLGHGVVIDHPGPPHVTVESPYGTRRISPISHVCPAPAATESVPPDRPPALPAADRWRHLFANEHPAVLADPHWPALAAQIDRIADTGVDVVDLVGRVAADRELPADHPARSLDYRLANAVPPPPSTRPGDDTPPVQESRNPAAGALTSPQARPRSGPAR